MRTIRVLIIDEEQEFASILTDRLNSWGFAATAATSLEEALDLMPATRPEVAVLGLRSSGSRELALLSALKSAYPALEVILLADKGAALAGMGGMERGAFDLLAHPIDLGVLIERIRLAADIRPTA